MRQIISSGSVKAIYLDSDVVIEKAKAIAHQALDNFPEIMEIRLFGSFATGKQSSLSDVDILVIIKDEVDLTDPLEAARPYHRFFSENLNIAVDIIVTTKNRYQELKNIIRESKIIAIRIPNS